MKRSLLFFSFILFLGFSLDAQVKTPAPSPAAKLSQKVGLTDVTVEYSRPSMKGRKIFGGLLDYDKMWRTGANKNTMVSFSDDVMVGGKKLEKGTYSLFTKPGMVMWDVYFYKNIENWGTPSEWKEEDVAAHLNIKSEEMDFDLETLLITIGEITSEGAVLEVIWENKYIAIPFTVPTEAKVTASIESIMDGPAWRDYYESARYYRETKKDLNRAEEWMHMAIEKKGEPTFWILRQLALIQADRGNHKAAIETAEKSLVMAKEAGNSDYVKSNEKSLAEWRK